MINYKPVIGFANQKGGVGKTTSAKMFSEFCASIKNRQTLGIDMDPQYSFSARFLGTHKNPITDYKEPPLHPQYNLEMANGWDGKSSIANIFFGEKVIPYPTLVKNLEIAPSDEGKLFKAENVKRQEMAEKVYSQLYNFISIREVQDAYDVFVIDTPPAKGPLTVAAFKAMTHLVIPLEIELQAIEGLQGILQLWKQEALSRSSDRPLELIGVLPNKIHSRRGTDKDLLKELRKNPELSAYIMPFEIIDRKTFPEADLQQKSIFQYPESDEARREAFAACKYIYERAFK
jgi:chromosome partitioning protein